MDQNRPEPIVGSMQRDESSRTSPPGTEAKAASTGAEDGRQPALTQNQRSSYANGQIPSADVSGQSGADAKLARAENTSAYGAAERRRSDQNRANSAQNAGTCTRGNLPYMGKTDVNGVPKQPAVPHSAAERLPGTAAGMPPKSTARANGHDRLPAANAPSAEGPACASSGIGTESLQAQGPASLAADRETGPHGVQQIPPSGCHAGMLNAAGLAPGTRSSHGAPQNAHGAPSSSPGSHNVPLAPEGTHMPPTPWPQPVPRVTSGIRRKTYGKPINPGQQQGPLMFGNTGESRLPVPQGGAELKRRAYSGTKKAQSDSLPGDAAPEKPGSMPKENESASSAPKQNPLAGPVPATQTPSVPNLVIEPEPEPSLVTEPEPEPSLVIEPEPEPSLVIEPEPEPSPVPYPPAPVPLSDEEVVRQTASQWKYRAVPFAGPENYPEYRETEEAAYEKYGILGARVRGKKHKRAGTNCDDWFEIANLDSIRIIAVADGAGSKKFSRIGARISCETTIASIVKALEEMGGEKIAADLSQASSSPEFMAVAAKVSESLRNAVLEASEAVTRAADDRKDKESFIRQLDRTPTPSDFACTLLTAVIVPLGGREFFVGTCQVGDGMIAVFDTEGDFEKAVRLLAKPDSGEFSGETEFITSPSIRDPKALIGRTHVFQGMCDAVMVMTDGVADDYYPNGTQLPRLYLDMLANGILSEKRAEEPEASEELLSGIPEPVSFPWVNDPQTVVSLQYTDRLCREMKLELQDLWERRGEIMSGVKKTVNGGEDLGEERSVRLRTWLDNYACRGSFDDRTLVIADLRKERP